MKNNIDEVYVSYDIAKLLRKKGFNEMVDSCYEYAVMHNGKYIDEDDEYSLKVNGKAREIKYIPGGSIFEHWNRNSDCGKYSCSRPSISVAMRWLREKRNLFVEPHIQSDGTYIGFIYNTDGCNLTGIDKRRVRKSYEGACEAAIKYCLVNLL